MILETSAASSLTEGKGSWVGNFCSSGWMFLGSSFEDFHLFWAGVCAAWNRSGKAMLRDVTETGDGRKAEAARWAANKLSRGGIVIIWGGD